MYSTAMTPPPTIAHASGRSGMVPISVASTTTPLWKGSGAPEASVCGRFGLRVRGAVRAWCVFRIRGVRRHGQVHCPSKKEE